MNCYSLLIVLTSVLFSCFAYTAPVRINGDSSYKSVGLLAFQGHSSCSGIVIKHGVFLTAKHCFLMRPFSEASLLSWSLHFLTNSPEAKGSIMIPGEKIKKIFLDKGDNDLAYVLYDPALTDNRISIEITDFIAEAPRQDDSARLVGFPAQEKFLNENPKVISKGCSFTGVVGKANNTLSGPEYRGILDGTNCGAYWGNSGGPAFVIDPATKGFTKLAGVVTHTFATIADGSIDLSKIQTDGFGKFINDTNVSLVNRNASLKDVLSIDLAEIPNAEKTAPIPINQFCGYSSFSELMAEARKAIDSLNTTAFKPTFWIDKNPDFEKIALEHMGKKIRRS